MKATEKAAEPPKKPHSVQIENCARGAITGVEKVVSSNENSLVLQTSMGGLTVSGSGLKINKFDVTDGTLSFEGAVASVRYSAAKIPLLKRIFR